MSLARTFDPERMTQVVSHPDVQPFVSLGQALPDLAPVIADHSNVCLMNEHGGFLFCKVEPEIFEVHTAFVPEGRGPHIVKLAKEAARFMFEQTDAQHITTFVAYGNKAAQSLAEKVGFEVMGESERFGVAGVNMVLSEDVCQ